MPRTSTSTRVDRFASADQIGNRIARERKQDAAEALRAASLAARRRDAPPKRQADPRDADEPTPAMVQAKIRRSVITPAVITVPCPLGHAPAGQPCVPTARGVCWQRVVARASMR